MLIKKNLTYKLLIKLLYVKSKKFNNIPNKNSNFDIKLYLIGLSFNRFIFNLDKIIFMLCIITNFLLFLNLNKNNILFIGNPEHKDFIKKYALASNQKYYENFLLPGTFSGIEPASLYYKSLGKNQIFKDIDCVISLSCKHHNQFLVEIFKNCIPIISLINEKNSITKLITYPIFIVDNSKYVYFFMQYFCKILNHNKC